MCLIVVRRLCSTPARFFAFTFRAHRIPVDEHRAWSDVDLTQGRWPRSRDRGENTRGSADDEGEDKDEGIDEEDNDEANEVEDNEDKEDIKSGVEGEREDDNDSDGIVRQGDEDEH
ncbi:hypothetical protein G7Y89_g1336 [Cudoniella acicularis]|uniref:Uncharacterized protein n=1 Tax=Cudoniella acicularis TaxID=354080 RepID=A0A8H4RX43_9HELO|nr:hypothetical protein G7Y89_g1336 [Cudoniella acicularis]